MGELLSHLQFWPPLLPRRRQRKRADTVYRAPSQMKKKNTKLSFGLTKDSFGKFSNDTLLSFRLFHEVIYWWGTRADADSSDGSEAVIMSISPCVSCIIVLNFPPGAFLVLSSLPVSISALFYFSTFNFSSVSIRFHLAALLKLFFSHMNLFFSPCTLQFSLFSFSNHLALIPFPLIYMLLYCFPTSPPALISG